MIFGSLITLVPTAARWLMSNSAAIGEAFNTIKNVAGGFTRVSEDVDELIFIPHPEAHDEPTVPSTTNIEKYLKGANKVLEKEAEKIADPDRSNRRKVWSSDMNALWLDPSNPVNNVPSQAMYRDLAQHLREYDYPLSFAMADGTTADVPYRLAQALFANEPSKGATIRIDDKTHLKRSGFTIESKDKECTIKARYVHYNLPLGKQGTENAWHAALHANISMTRDFEAQHEREKQSFFYISSDEPPRGAVWILTCEIDWRTVIMARNGHRQLDGKLKASKDYFVALSNLEANIQIVKIVAPASDAPSQVRAYVEVLVAEISRNLTKTPHLLDAKTEPLMAQGPIVEVTNSSYLGNYENTSDYQLAYDRHLESKKLAAQKLESMLGAEMIDIKDCGEMAM